MTYSFLFHCFIVVVVGKGVEGVRKAVMVVAADQLKQNHKRKKKKATSVRKGVNPFTKEPLP